MPCILCNKKAVIEEQQGPLCREHFIRYFQKKAYGTIRKYRLFTKKDRLCVACSGGKDSLAVLYLASMLAKKQRQHLFAVGIDEGMRGRSKMRIGNVTRLCERQGTDCVIVSFREEFGHTIEELMGIARKKKLGVSRFTLCRALRRILIDKYSAKFGATRVITGHNLDDEVRDFMLDIFGGRLELAAMMGPAGPAAKKGGSIPRVKPLYFCGGNETELYAKFMRLGTLNEEGPHGKHPHGDFVAEKIDELEREYKGTKTSVVRNLLNMLPSIRERHSARKASECKRCGEPAGKGRCTVCDAIGKLGIGPL